MTIKDLDVLKQDLTDLKAKVAAQDAKKSADDKAAVEVKEYRNFLESMTDRALKTFGIVIAITAAALTVIGIKSFWEITDKAQVSANARIEKYLSDHLIDSMIQERITEYQRAATIEYYVSQSITSSPARIPPDPVLEKVLESTLNLTHRKYLIDSAKIVGSYDYFSKDPELSKRFGDLLLKSLTDSYQAESVMLDDNTQVAIVDALGKLGRKEAGPPLWKLFRDARTSNSYRMAFAHNLSSVIGSDDLLHQILADMPIAKGQKGNNYSAELVAVLLTSPDNSLGLSELQSLAADQSWASANAQGDVIREVFLTDDGGFDSKAADQSVAFAANKFFYPLILSGRLYLAIDRDDMFVQRMMMGRNFERRRRSPFINLSARAQLRLWLRTSDGGASGVDGESLLSSSVFPKLLSGGLADTNAANRVKVVHGILIPLAAYLKAVEKENSGSSSEMAFRGHLTVSGQFEVPEAKGQKFVKIVVSDLPKDGDTVDLTGYTEQDNSPVHFKRKLSEIDLSKITFTPGIEQQ